MAAESWLKELTKRLQQRMGEEYQVTEVDRSKFTTDGEIQIGIMKKEERTGILLNLEPQKVQRLKKGIGLEDEVNVLAETYREKRNTLIEELLVGEDFAIMKERIIYALERKEGNEKALIHIPWNDYLDMVIVFYLIETPGGDTNYRTISNKDLDVWKVSKEEIWEIARENTPKLCRPWILAKEDALKENAEDEGVSLEDMEEYLMKNSQMDFPIFSLSNQYGFYGASVILYDGLLEQVSRIWKDDVLVIPTGISEVLIVPCLRSRNTVLEWRDILQQLNQEQSQKEEALSESVYFYDREEKMLRIADSWDTIFDS